MTFGLIIFIIILLALFGMPLFAVILSLAISGFYFSGIDLSVIAIEIYRLTNTPLLLALPLFTFAGYLLSHSNTSHRLVRLSRVFLSWLPVSLLLLAWSLALYLPPLLAQQE